MIQPNSFAEDHIRQLQRISKRDPILLERAVYAFGLLEALARVGMPFIFKGGTCLMLLMERPRRLSTDIDIIVRPGTDLDAFLEKASRIFPFQSVEEQKRVGKNQIEKRHFKFTYDSPVNHKPLYILLDVLFEENHYAEVINREIRNELLLTQPEYLITNKKENATCSNSEAPIVSNGNVSEESGSDIAHAENYVPTEEDVLVARQQATEGMSQQQVERLTEVIKAANLWLEQRYMDENLFEKLSDPNSLYWNYFHQTGEIQIGWAVDGSIDIDAVCKREKLSLEEFYAKYGTPVVATNFYDADGFIDLLSEMKSFLSSRRPMKFPISTTRRKRSWRRCMTVWN